MKCKFCSSTNLKNNIFSKDYNRKISEITFSYTRCMFCCSVFLNDIPENLTHYYSNGYGLYEANEQTIKVHRLYEEEKIALLSKYIKKGAVLEIGAAAGMFLKLASSRGYEMSGLELDEDCVKRLIDEGYEVRKTNNPADDIRAFNKKFNAIVAWHVIEHLPEAVDLLSKLKENLKQDGIVIFSLPNPEALSFRFFKKYWEHLDAPRHISLISKKALVSLMEKNGFSSLESHADDAISKDIDRSGWYTSYHNLLNDNGSMYKQWPLPIIKIIGKCLKYTVPISLWIGKNLKKEASYTIVFRALPSK
jgi:2-polyprenyl-3-methyl-5-hydroxy-6-metoxy-1,4-benzoquinol methylase